MSRAQAVKIAGFGGDDEKKPALHDKKPALHDEKPTLYDVELLKIVKDIPEGTPIQIVSIAGVHNSGKSFLLSVFISYLAYLVKNDNDGGWEDSDYSVEGFYWAQRDEDESVTIGIWMWSRPFIITRKDQTKIAILLVDSQGTGSFVQAELDALIMYLCLQISSVLLLNFPSSFTADNLDKLQLFSTCVEHDGHTSEDVLFPSLVFIQRNHEGKRGTGEDPTRLQRIIEKLREGSDIERVVSGIRMTFTNQTFFNMPYPGKPIARASSGANWKLTDIPLEFSLNAKELFLLIVTKVREGGKEWNSVIDLNVNIQMLKERLERDDLPSIGNRADALKEYLLHQEWRATMLDFTDRLRNQCGYVHWNSFQDEQQLNTASGEVVRLATESFERAAENRNLRNMQSFETCKTELEAYFCLKLNELKLHFLTYKECCAMATRDEAFQKSLAELSEATETRREEILGDLIQRLRNSNSEYNQRINGLIATIKANKYFYASVGITVGGIFAAGFGVIAYGILAGGANLLASEAVASAFAVGSVCVQSIFAKFPK